ncbi:MAG: hypothetical protein AABN34_09470 [Acidobacteriota bacterium]
MKRTVLVLIPIAMVVGCQRPVHISQSTFLSKFSLERSAKQTGYKGINNFPGPGGSIGGSSGLGGGTTGPQGTRWQQSSTTGFMINQDGENKFNESEFMEALTSQLKKEIEENSGRITGSGSPSSNEFYINYKDGNINGRITISGSGRGQPYVLNANVDETSKP